MFQLRSGRHPGRGLEEFPGFHPGYDWAKYIADAALFPASDESSFAIGAPFVIDEEYVAR